MGISTLLAFGALRQRAEKTWLGRQVLLAASAYSDWQCDRRAAAAKTTTELAMSDRGLGDLRRRPADLLHGLSNSGIRIKFGGILLR